MYGNDGKRNANIRTELNNSQNFLRLLNFIDTIKSGRKQTKYF